MLVGCLPEILRSQKKQQLLIAKSPPACRVVGRFRDARAETRHQPNGFAFASRGASGASRYAAAMCVDSSRAFNVLSRFMTGVKQTYSRDYKIAIDTLTIGCQVRKKKKEKKRRKKKEEKKSERCVLRIVSSRGWLRRRAASCAFFSGGILFGFIYPSRSRVVVQSSKKNIRFLEL